MLEWKFGIGQAPKSFTIDFDFLVFFKDYHLRICFIEF